MTFSGTVNKLFEHDQKIVVLSEQVSQVVSMCKDMRLELKALTAYAERHAERDAIYDKIVRIVPVLIAAFSGIYWVFAHMQKV